MTSMYTQLYGDETDFEKELIECDRVFVYGTLKRGKSNHSILQNADFLVTTETRDGYCLGNVGFPYAFPSGVTPDEYKNLLFPVRGEVFKIADQDTFQALDWLEGYPWHYNRKIVEVAAGMKAWMYRQEDWSCAPSCNACQLKEGAWEWH